jgi:hypothetical protein
MENVSNFSRFFKSAYLESGIDDHDRFNIGSCTGKWMDGRAQRYRNVHIHSFYEPPCSHSDGGGL